LQSSPAYLLVSHGSSDSRPKVAATKLADLFAQKVCQAEPVAQPLVGTACLEGDRFPLHKQVEQFAKRLWASAEPGFTPRVLVVLPLFLLSGVHVMIDIPTELALAQQALGETVSIRLVSHLGSHPGLARLVIERMAIAPVEAWVLLAHGSRRPGANEAIATFADHLGAIAAYWAVAPTLEERLQELQALGIRTVNIFPYFLFAGGITEAIAQLVDRLAPEFPALKLHLTTPLAVSPELADLLVDLTRQGIRDERFEA